VSAGRSGVSEEQIIKVGSDQVPGISVWTACFEEIGICKDISWLVSKWYIFKGRY
jgi:hypothetical protein